MIADAVGQPPGDETDPPSTLKVLHRRIPEELRARPQWVNWLWEQRNGKWTKTPINPNTGRYARSNDPSTWGAFTEAWERYQDGKVAGLGFVFSADDPYTGIDLDGCVDPESEQMAPWALEIVEELDSYTELSPSGTGLHVLVQGALPRSEARRNRKGPIEMYDAGRYFTITGRAYSETPPAISTRQAELDALYRRALATERPDSTRQRPDMGREAVESSGPRLPRLLDDELLTRFRHARNVSKFSRLFDQGDRTDYDGDDSRADQALCCLFAWWTDDPDQIDRLFRRSALYRDKWERADYRDRTIRKALAWVADQRQRERGQRDQLVPDFEDNGDAVQPWEPPTPLTTAGERPPFPTDLLPDPLCSYVATLAEETQTPADLPGMISLAAIATAAAGRVDVEVRQGWVEPVNVYAVIALGSGNRKSPVTSRIMGPLRAYEKAKARELAAEIAQVESRRKIAQQALDRAQRAAARAAPGSDDYWRCQEDADRIARELAESPELRVPTVPRLLADDCTPEKLAVLMADNDGRIGVLSAEGGIVDIMAGRFSKDGKTPNLDLYLKAHAGDDFASDRIGRASLRLSAPALTLGLAVQPEVLHGLAMRPGFRGRGLLARFAYALPQSFVGHRKVKARPVPADVEAAYAALINAIVALKPAGDVHEEPTAHHLSFSVQAEARFTLFEEALEPRLGADGDLGHIADWGAKLAGLVARVAGLFHVVECTARQVRPWHEEIDVATVERAIAFAETYLLPHALSAFGMMGSDPAVAEAAHVLRAVERWRDAEGSIFSRRDLYQASLKRRFRSQDELRRPLELLIEHGFIRPLAGDPSTGPGRKASPRFEINPLWRSQNPQNPQNPPSS